MITYIIVTRNPKTKAITIIMNDDHVAEYITEDEAFEAAKTIELCRAWGAMIVPIGEAIPA